MNRITLFADGPWQSLHATRSRIVVETDAQRLLHWGAQPVPSNDHNAALLIESVRKLRGEGRWYGMDPARILRLSGWPEGLAIAQRYCQELPRFQMESIQRRRVWDVAGDEFDRDRFDAGLEECWSSRKRTRTAARPILKLTCAIGGAAKKHAEQLTWMGAAAFALCDAAEAAGYRMEIEAISQTYDTFCDDGHDLVQRIRIKTAEEPLDRETTVMALACPAFFRWHTIRSRCAIAPELRMDRGAGCTREIDAQFHGDLHMPHAYDVHTAQAAVATLVRQIERMAHSAC